MPLEGALTAFLGGEIGFARPWAALLAPLPLAFRALAPPAPPGGALEPPVGIARWLSGLGGEAGRRAVSDARRSVIVGWGLILAALSGPFLHGKVLIEPTGRETILALDISASMAEQDMEGPEGPVARIEAMRAVGRGFLGGRAGDRVALIGFATDAYLIAPPTHDLKAVAAMLDEMNVGMPGRRTDLGQAVGLAVRVLRDAPEGERLLLLMTDGETNAGDLGAVDAARLALGTGVRLHLIGFASAIEPEHRAFLETVASAAGGRYHEAADPDALARIAEEVAALAPIAAPAAPLRLINDRAPLFAAAALALAVFVMWRERKGW